MSVEQTPGSGPTTVAAEKEKIAPAPDWSVQLQTMFGVLLSVSYGALLGSGVPNADWNELDGANTVWVLVVVGAIIISLDAWYNMLLYFRGSRIDSSQGLLIGLIVIFMLVFSFLPLQFVARVTSAEKLWLTIAPVTAFWFNTVIVCLIDGVLKLLINLKLLVLDRPESPDPDYGLAMQAWSRPLIGIILFFMYLLIFQDADNITKAPVGATLALLIFWTAYRLAEHIVGTKLLIPLYTKRRARERTSSPAT